MQCDYLLNDFLVTVLTISIDAPDHPRIPIPFMVPDCILVLIESW